MTIREAADADIPFLVEAIIEAEASGSPRVSYREIFSLDDAAVRTLFENVLAERLEGCGWCPTEFLVAERQDEAAACCAAWVEGAAGLSSNIIRSQLLLEFVGAQRWRDAAARLAAVAELNINRTAGALQIDAVYTKPAHRGHRLSGSLIREHLARAAGAGVTSAEIQVMKDNTAAVSSYRGAGFSVATEKRSHNGAVLQLLPGDSKLMMRQDQS